MSACCDIYCPDCGQGFPQEMYHDQENNIGHCSHSQFHNTQSNDAVFKKPNVLAKVLKCIWKPFKPAQSIQFQSRSFVPRPGSPYPQLYPYSPRTTYNHSDVASETGSWLGSIFNYSNWNRKRQSNMNDLQNSRPVRHFTGNYSHPPSRTHDHCCSAVYGSDSSYTPDQIERVEHDNEDADSDRLNLKEYVQPKKRKYEEVESWVNNLKDDMDAINSLLSVDLSCDCKSGVAKTRNDLITNFLAETSDQVLKLQELLNIQESYELAKLDKEADEEARNLAQQQTRQVETLQRELLMETVKSDSESLLDYYS